MRSHLLWLKLKRRFGWLCCCTAATHATTVAFSCCWTLSNAGREST